MDGTLNLSITKYKVGGTQNPYNFIETFYFFMKILSYAYKTLGHDSN